MTTQANKAAPAKSPAKRTSKAKGKAAPASKSIASKPNAAAVSKATAPAMVSAHTITASSKTPYKALTAKRSHFSAWLLAAAETAGIVSGISTGKGAPAKKTGGSLSLFGALIGPRARKHWADSGRLDGSGLTVAGLNEMNNRISGQSKGYDTTREIVAAFAQAMAKGGTVKVDDATYEFGSQVSVKK